MMVACARWDDQGGGCIPVWDGTAWTYYADKALSVPVTSPPDARVRVVPGGWLLVAYFYNDDGSCPDTRPMKGPYVTRRLQIPKYNRVGRQRTAAEVQADIDHWLSEQAADIKACVAKVCKKPHESSRFSETMTFRPALDCDHCGDD